MPHLFTSPRLGFRNWTDTDIPLMAHISADPEVMRFFPSVTSLKETINFIERQQLQFAAKGFCYFAVDRLEDGAMIGFIGFSAQDFEASFTPCIDIGWRLGHAFWGQGYATEGANRCLEFAFAALNLEEVVAIAPAVNKPSIHVMEKIGMQEKTRFQHPKLTNFPDLLDCVCYSKTKQY